MSSEGNEAVVRSLYEAENKQNLAFLDELLAPDYVDHTLQWRGLEAIGEWRESMTMVYKGFPDWHETVEDIIAEGDKVWLRITCTGTHRRVSWTSSYWQEDNIDICLNLAYS
jgi:C-1 hydroxylase